MAAVHFHVETSMRTGTAARYLAGQLGAPVALGWPAATATSNNCAFGGARNGIGNYNSEIGNPPGLGAAFPVLSQTGLQRQVERYAGQTALGVPDPTRTLFMVCGSPNDSFLGAETIADPAVFVAQDARAPAIERASAFERARPRVGGTTPGRGRLNVAPGSSDAIADDCAATSHGRG